GRGGRDDFRRGHRLLPMCRRKHFRIHLLGRACRHPHFHRHLEHDCFGGIAAFVITRLRHQRNLNRVPPPRCIRRHLHRQAQLHPPPPSPQLENKPCPRPRTPSCPPAPAVRRFPCPPAPSPVQR